MRRLLFLFAFLCAPVSAAPEPTSYVVVGERSQVAFDATFPLGDFSGTTDRVAGEFRLDPADVPHGVSLWAKPYDERVLVRLGSALESRLGAAGRRPAGF